MLAGCEEQRKARCIDAIKADKQVVGVTEKDSHERNQCKWIMQLCWPQMGAAERRRRSLSAQTDSRVISYNFCTATRKVILRYDCQDTWGEMILLIPLWHVHFFSSVLWQIAFGVYCTNKWFWPSLLMLCVLLTWHQFSITGTRSASFAIIKKKKNNFHSCFSFVPTNVMKVQWKKGKNFLNLKVITWWHFLNRLATRIIPCN